MVIAAIQNKQTSCCSIREKRSIQQQRTLYLSFSVMSNSNNYKNKENIPFEKCSTILKRVILIASSEVVKFCRICIISEEFIFRNDYEKNKIRKTKQQMK